MAESSVALPPVSVETHMPLQAFNPHRRLTTPYPWRAAEPGVPRLRQHHEGLGTIPKLGVRPEQLIFICPSCKEVAAKRYLWRDILKMRRQQAGHSVKTNHVSQRVTATDANANPVAN